MSALRRGYFLTAHNGSSVRQSRRTAQSATNGECRDPASTPSDCSVGEEEGEVQQVEGPHSAEQFDICANSSVQLSPPLAKQTTMNYRVNYCSLFYTRASDPSPLPPPPPPTVSRSYVASRISEPSG